MKKNINNNKNETHEKNIKKKGEEVLKRKEIQGKERENKTMMHLIMPKGNDEMIRNQTREWLADIPSFKLS